jgi:trehalose-phosphatase
VNAPEPTFDEPTAVAAEVASLGRPLLAAFDVDGVLAPIVAHAADAALLPGLLDAVSGLAARTSVGIVSGRNVENLSRFGFPEVLLVAGSHGAERRGRPLAPLTVAETERLARLRVLADRGARDAGGGAWVETKPTAVVVHVREADPATAEPALAALTKAAASVPGAHVRRGHRIVELAVRAASKAAAIAEMRSEVGAAAVSFIGDDITDEDVFAALGPGDLGVRVGAGRTSARRRLRDPADVLTFVRHLTPRV